ncbi:DNA methyltransferase [Pseudorhodoferax sp. Leaf274]|uniref:DNA methyltransferase n=1 Tax=Pseudorhodoferax sp. Leaf274 TaxID=1736318 RepID=UPI0009E81B00|nr:DNA methyltransferase [Pseudorhodoferax sp. Leaf274]
MSKQTVPIQDAAAARVDNAFLHHSDAMQLYERWPQPTCIIADGPYGLAKFPGEPPTVDPLPAWYGPHVAAWARRAAPDCTLWFWGSELSWATVHSVLDLHGWQYEETVVWDKGIAHIAGNVNSRTIRGLPVVTEVAVRYTRKNLLVDACGNLLPLKAWVRSEWQRSGLPMHLANLACGVRNAATRKYLTQCHRWYFPPVEAMRGMANYCREHGAPAERPYFSLDGVNPFDGEAWIRMRSKWTHTHGQTNVWREQPVHGRERVKTADGVGYLHANQKPLALMEKQILSCTNEGDVVWEPFGGLCSASLAASQLGRRAFAAEIHAGFYHAAVERLREALDPPQLRIA